MRRYVALCFLGAGICAPAFAEQQFALEFGQGNHWSKGADAGFARYSRELTFPDYPRQEGFYEFSFGSWDHKHPNNAAGLAIGTRERWDQIYLEASTGVAVAEHKTRLSNTHQQFILRAGVGYQFNKKVDVGFFYTHYSNAKPIFDWDGKNVGYDFMTLQLRYTTGKK